MQKILNSKWFWLAVVIGWTWFFGMMIYAVAMGDRLPVCPEASMGMCRTEGK